MKKTISIIIAIVISFTINAQNKIDDNGQKIGKWSKKYDNGNLRYKGQFEKGYEVGKFIYYFPNGKKKSIMTFSETGKKAKVVTYYINGNQQSTGLYYEKKKDGVWKFFDKIKGDLVKQESYNKGVKDGLWIVYYIGKGKATELNWKDGKRDGVWKEYFENGELKLSATFSDDKMVGDYSSYYLSKNISRQGKYVDGVQDGVWNAYEENGTFSSVIVYNNGHLDKETRYENGKITLIIDHVNNTVKNYLKNDDDGGEE